jgi:pimeloyl-ACP methyl ester carboxylesterase
MTPFTLPGGTSLAVHTLGDPAHRPLLLLHGLFSNVATNWIKYGTAAELVSAGRYLILPDFRAHGESDAPTDPAHYPPDVLAQDIEALIAHLALSDYDLGGYSLGARTCVRLFIRGLIPPPKKLILGGMGLAGITGGKARASFFLNVIEAKDTFPAGTAEYAAQAFMRQSKINGPAVANVIRAQVSTPPAALAALVSPTLVIAGAQDSDNGSAQDLALTLPNAAHLSVPGNHMSAVTKPDFGSAMAAWLGH